MNLIKKKYPRTRIVDKYKKPIYLCAQSWGKLTTLEKYYNLLVGTEYATDARETSTIMMKDVFLHKGTKKND